MKKTASPLVRKRLFCSTACFLALAITPKAMSFTDSLDLSQIPEGFHDLAGPQTTVADFYYGGRYLTSATLTYTPDTVTIHDPAGLVSRIQNVSRTDSVEAALTGEIFSNPALACSSAGQSDCGRLTPDVAGLIFDSYRFRVDVFVAEPYLHTTLLEQSKYLPESTSSLGMLQGLSGAVSGISGTDNNHDNYSLFGNTLIGWRENHLVANWDIATEQDFSFDNLYLGRDANGWQIGAGYMDQSGLMTTDFASGQSVLGVRIGSSLNSRMDMANVNSTPIPIFANGRRRVEVFRDDRLIYATNVEAGSQEIDTRSFPQGAYNVTVRVFDGSILTQEFTRFFTKSVRLPPSDEILWYLEGGEMTRRNQNEVLPGSTGQWLLRGGIGKRIAENAGLELRTLANDDEQLGEAEIFYQGDGWELTTKGMYSSEDARGAALEASMPFGPAYLSYYHRRLWNDDYQLDPVNDNDTRLLGEGFENRTLSLSSGLLGGSFSASYSYNKQDNRDESEDIYSFSWTKTIMRIAGHDISLQMRYSEKNDDKIGNLDLTVRRSTRGWNYSARSQNRWNKTGDESVERDSGYNLDSRWYRDEFLNGKGEAGLRFDDTPGDGRTLGGDLRYEQTRFLAEANADYVDRNDDQYVNYTGRLETSFAINSSGAAIGGGRSSDSAVIVEVEGSEQAVFDVLVNGSTSGIARGGSKTVVPLSPYGTYGVSIRPRGINFHNYDQGEKIVTLYPGNVETVSYQSYEELVLLGKLVNSEGDALASAMIAGGTGFTRTDQYGIFQVRVPSTEKQLRVTLANNEQCIADISTDYTKRAGVGLLGELECKAGE